MAKLVLFDMDGTLSNDSQRRHFYDNQEWERYFSYDAQMADVPYEAGRALYEEMLLGGWTPGYLTARLERNRPATTDWLTKYEFQNPRAAYLRPEQLSTQRPAAFKSSIIDFLRREGEYEHIILIDNDPIVVQRISDDHGEEFVYFADWDLNSDLASIGVG